jgi:hypothetical protein
LEGQKLVIIINGKGGCGKDTICDILEKHYPVKRISTITKVKQAARLMFGWKGEKSLKDRKFLSDLKDLWTDYNDGPFKYAISEFQKFAEKPVVAYNEILIIHVREPSEIKKIKNRIDFISIVPCVTLLITSPRTESVEYGNEADDLVNKYPYDFRYNNAAPLNEVDEDFMGFFYKFIAPSWQESH